MLNIISLGAGVQSSAMALMAAAREITPMPDAAIFSDTGWEPAGVYVWLDWLERQLPFPVYRVTAGNIRDDLTRDRSNNLNNRWVAPPLYTLSESGSRGMIRRQCTSEYKIAPLRKKQRELLGLKPRQRAKKGVSMSAWIGISSDEIQRMKDNPDAWAVNRWPLVELRMTRDDCMAWIHKNVSDLAPPVTRSACIGCPFRSNKEWLTLSKQEFSDACEVDELLRTTYGRTGRGGGKDMKDLVFLHADRMPLRKVDLGREHKERQYSLLDECEGMCGV